MVSDELFRNFELLKTEYAKNCNLQVLTFYIFSFDALNEPPHLHVVRERSSRQRSSKIWLNSCQIEERGSLSEKEINLVVALVKNNQKILIEAFNKAKDGKKIKTIKLK